MRWSFGGGVCRSLLPGKYLDFAFGGRRHRKGGTRYKARKKHECPKVSKVVINNECDDTRMVGTSSYRETGHGLTTSGV
jgi:hypothetical protein